MEIIKMKNRYPKIHKNYRHLTSMCKIKMISLQKIQEKLTGKWKPLKEGFVPYGIIGPAMPSRELLAAAAEMTEALRCWDAEMEADDDFLIGPPPPAMVAEAASANEAERFEELSRVLSYLRLRARPLNYQQTS